MAPVPRKKNTATGTLDEVLAARWSNRRQLCAVISHATCAPGVPTGMNPKTTGRECALQSAQSKTSCRLFDFRERTETPVVNFALSSEMDIAIVRFDADDRSLHLFATEM
jgi:hypothetical protein